MPPRSVAQWPEHRSPKGLLVVCSHSVLYRPVAISPDFSGFSANRHPPRNPPFRAVRCQFRCQLFTQISFSTSAISLCVSASIARSVGAIIGRRNASGKVWWARRASSPTRSKYPNGSFVGTGGMDVVTGSVGGNVGVGDCGGGLFIMGAALTSSCE